MIQIENPAKPLQTENFFNQTWKVENELGLVFYQLLGQDSPDTVETKKIIRASNHEIARLYPGVSVLQKIALCPEELYVERFLQKARRFDFDPKPWIDWSEGDNDIVGEVDKVFCIRVGAKFESSGDKERFYAHELGHPYSSSVSPIFDPIGGEILLADTEGLVEADARIALEIQARDDMKFSRDFITSLKDNELATPKEVGISGYDHSAFINKTVSLNPGYASCFLWFLGQAVRAGKRGNGDVSLKNQYLRGRGKLLDIAKRSSTKVEYKELLLAELGFDYDREAKSTSFLNETRQLLLSL